MKNTSILLCAALFAAINVVGCSKEPAEDKVAQAPAPDNSGTNVRDRDDQTKTAGDQSESEADRTISQNIRQSLTADNGKNVKVITVDGKVTLRGPVKSDQEKAAIAAKAQQVAGVKNVDNQLEIATN
jgi:hyperosmotically inducible periplasmic protein